MIAYQQFVELTASANSQDRGMAAHLAATAFVRHNGPADENAALYAALIGFLDDRSVKVRAALAYGLLHATSAPRPIMLALLADAPIIARAVAQFSPVVLDADLLPIVADADRTMLHAIAARTKLGIEVAKAVIRRDIKEISLIALQRAEVAFGAATLSGFAVKYGSDAEFRGVLFSRKDLPAEARLGLIQCAKAALGGSDLVRRAIPARRISRLLRDTTDRASVEIIDRQDDEGRAALVKGLAAAGMVHTRLLLHALVHGHAAFFSDCIASLANIPASKAKSILNGGNRSSLRALLARTGMASGLCDLSIRLIELARDADLADDLAARHFVVTSLLSEMVEKTGATVPEDLQTAFTYLGEQNISLARHAARGVMLSFAEDSAPHRVIPATLQPEPLALPVASAA